MTETIQEQGEGPDGGGLAARVGLLAALGAASGVVAGLIDFSELFYDYFIYYPVPGTDFDFFINSSVIVPGALFGVAMVAALSRWGLTNGAGATFIFASTAGSLIGSNASFFLALSVGVAEDTSELWVMSASLDGAITAVILATAARSFGWSRTPKNWLLLSAVGVAAAVICANLAFGGLDESAFGETNSGKFYWAWIAQMAVFYAAFGAALGFVAPVAPRGNRPKSAVASSEPTITR